MEIVERMIAVATALGDEAAAQWHEAGMPKMSGTLQAQAAERAFTRYLAEFDTTGILGQYRESFTAAWLRGYGSRVSSG